MPSSTPYSILVDDTQDVSKTEQQSFVLRFVNTSKCEINERFIGYCRLLKTDAQTNNTKYTEFSK